MRVRDHEPITIDSFNGLWSRGSEDSCPLDHFTDCENIQFREREVRTRDGVDTIAGPGNIVRAYRYKDPIKGEGHIALDENGNFWHTVYDPDQVFGPILIVATATDFAMRDIIGRAYISPITGIHGTDNEFLYVYLGNGVTARKAAGLKPTNTGGKQLFAYENTIEGVVTAGIHVIAISFLSGADRSTALGTEIQPVVYATGDKQIVVGNIPTSGVLQREVYMSQAIDPGVFDISTVYPMFLAKTLNSTDIMTQINIADADLTTAFVAGTQAVPTDGNALRAVQSTTPGHSDLGLHILAVIFETDTGFLTAPGPENFAVATFVDEGRGVTVTNIPVSSQPFVVKRHLVSSVAIEGWNGDPTAVQLFFIPSGVINDNVTTSLTFSYYDKDLFDDASHLIDNFEEIPAGAFLATFNARLVMGNTNDLEGTAYVSSPGEPEAINQVDGVLIPPYRTEELTNAQEYRDTLYIFKKNRTFAYIDNGDVPALWDEPTIIDNGIGAGFHSVATVLDSDGVNIEFLVIGHQSGLHLFNGVYPDPELSWKIQTLWLEMSGLNKGRDFELYTQVMTDSINKRIWMCTHERKIYYFDYNRGLDPKNIRMTPWRADFQVTTIIIFEGPRILLGSNGAFV